MPVLAPAPPVSPFEKALSLAVTDSAAGSRTNLPALAGSGPLVRQILTADYQMRYSAYLTRRAMEHAASLSAMEAQFTYTNSTGWHRYRALADSFAIGAVATITKGG